jgi:bacteriorhodopsin
MKHDVLENSFMITYLLLYGTALITLIEALRTPNVAVRHILNLETSVSLIAGFVYGIFIERLKSGALKLDDVTKLRYIDWSITTPLLLLVLLLFVSFESKSRVSFGFYSLIVLVNWIMLAVGYAAETESITRRNGLIFGFGAYAVLLFLIWSQCLYGGYDINSHTKLVFVAFAIIWGTYGIAFMLEPESKNIAYNTLDMISKVFFGIFMWVYYGGIFGKK